jgi:hypothetical protein
VSPANPDRVYAIVEAENGGLFRSDDAGKTWRQMSGDRLIQTRSWYYMNITADPKNADVVWVMNAPVMKSIDGGRTFASVSATHGDNHQLWINPTNPNYLINANDGGASISLDGGKSWSTQDNQPTSQFYHVAVDDGFPYKLYGGQQDNSSVIIQSQIAPAFRRGDMESGILAGADTVAAQLALPEGEARANVLKAGEATHKGGGSPLVTLIVLVLIFWVLSSVMRGGRRSLRRSGFGGPVILPPMGGWGGGGGFGGGGFGGGGGGFGGGGSSGSW